MLITFTVASKPPYCSVVFIGVYCNNLYMPNAGGLKIENSVLEGQKLFKNVNIIHEPHALSKVEGLVRQF